MWMLFHRKGKTRAVRDGESFVQECPDCGKRARFDEVEVTESYGVFFVDVVDDKERAFRCSACGELFDLKEKAPAKPAIDPAIDHAAIAARREGEIAERKRLAEKQAVRIEDELAELKARLGKR